MKGILKIKVKQGTIGTAIYPLIVQKLMETTSESLSVVTDAAEKTVVVTKTGSEQEVREFMKNGLKGKTGMLALKPFMSVSMETRQ